MKSNPKLFLDVWEEESFMIANEFRKDITLLATHMMVLPCSFLCTCMYLMKDRNLVKFAELNKLFIVWDLEHELADNNFLYGVKIVSKGILIKATWLLSQTF